MFSQRAIEDALRNSNSLISYYRFCFFRLHFNFSFFLCLLTRVMFLQSFLALKSRRDQEIETCSMASSGQCKSKETESSSRRSAGNTLDPQNLKLQMKFWAAQYDQALSLSGASSNKTFRFLGLFFLSINNRAQHNFSSFPFRFVILQQHTTGIRSVKFPERLINFNSGDFNARQIFY